MQTRLITSEDKLLSLKDSWNALVRENPETNVPFYSWDWFYRSWIHMDKPSDKTLAVVVAEDGKRVTGILPLVRSMRSSSRIRHGTLEFGNTGMSPRNSAYFDSQNTEAVFQALRDGLLAERHSWDMVELANLSEFSSFHRFWLEGKHPSLSSIQWQGFVAPFIELNGTIDDYFETLGRATRKDMRRRHRRFLDFGEEQKIVFYEKPEEIPEALEFFFEVRRQSWKGEFSTTRYKDFYREITPILCEKGGAFVAIAFLQGTPISAGYVLQDEKVFYSLVNDFDLRYREHVPGTMLFIHELEHLIATGRNKFDFCGTSYDYKERLAGSVNRHSTFQLFHRGLKSRFLYRAKTFWLPFFRKLFRKPADADMLSYKNG